VCEGLIPNPISEEMNRYLLARHFLAHHLLAHHLLAHHLLARHLLARNYCMARSLLAGTLGGCHANLHLSK